MMILKIQKKILESHPTELVEWMRKHPEFLYHAKDIFLKRFSQLSITRLEKTYMQNVLTLEDYISLLHLLFDERKTVTETEFQLMEELVRSVITKENAEDRPIGLMIPPSSVVKNPIVALTLVMLDQAFITNDGIQNANSLMNTAACQFYRWIMDIYIPSENSDHVVSLVWRNYPINQIIGNANNTHWFTTIYQEKNLHEEMHIREPELLFHYISDIFSNRVQKVEFFLELHKLFTGSYHVASQLSEMADRYRYYFKDYTESIITYLILLFTSESPDNELETFLYEYGGECDEVSTDVLKCFLDDVVKFTEETRPNEINREKISFIIHQVITLWNVACARKNTMFDDVILQPGERPVNDLIHMNDVLLGNVVANEALHNDSVKMNTAEKKIYKAYRTYKDAEEKVDSQLTKGVLGIKKAVEGDVKSEIIEGKKFSVLGLLKQILGTVAIFSFGKVRAICFLLVRFAMRKKTSDSERKKIMMELETEIAIMKEKVNDAKGDKNREAKYALMRSLKELENAHKRIRYGLEANQKSLNTAKGLLKKTAVGKAANVLSHIGG